MILSVHSPVFTAMFDKDIIKEADADADADDNVIKINDIELDVALQILEFVYTNKAPSKIDLHVDALMAASHKYQIDRLRNLCEEILYKNIKIDNAVKTLIIAELHGTEEFKKFIIEFFKNHGSLLKSNDFRNLEKDYPNLAIEVLRGIAIETANDK
ncbi:speckle-type POZ protein-like [Aphidius gifuensis]|uniref:speckle-type POZ protein-like n=1 Tax=Aphidius gifuensis TaxID=684658 RepID=UPI001CDB631F|nr:speckle-type POZ protein-like [Aphidius gifuensis]